MLKIYFIIGFAFAFFNIVFMLVAMEQCSTTFNDFYEYSYSIFKDTYLEKIVKACVVRRICFISTIAFDTIKCIVMWPISVIGSIILTISTILNFTK